MLVESRDDLSERHDAPPLLAFRLEQPLAKGGELVVGNLGIEVVLVVAPCVVREEEEAFEGIR